MGVLAVIISVFFFSIITYMIVHFRLIKYKKIYMLDWFLLAIATINGIGFIFVIWSTYKGFNTYNWEIQIKKYTTTDMLYYILYNFILAICTIMGWYLASSCKSKKKDIGSSFINKDRYIKKFKSISWIMLITSIVCYTIYSIPYGGLMGILNYTVAIRSGYVISSPFSFMQRFGYLSIFSSFIFLGIIIDKNVDKINKKYCLIGYILSFIFSLYVLYSLAGRVSLMVYLVTFLLGNTLYKKKSLLKLFKTILIISVIVIFGMPIISKVLGRSGDEFNTIQLMTKEMSFPIASFINNITNYEYRFFKDIIVAPLFVLPERIWGSLFNIETATNYNTVLIAGAKKGRGGVSGAIPVDIVTLSDMQLSIVGCIVIGLIFGFILCYIQNKAESIKIRGVKELVYSNLVFNVAMLSIMYADPRHIISRNFYNIIGFILIDIFIKVKFNNKKSIIN